MWSTSYHDLKLPFSYLSGKNTVRYHFLILTVPENRDFAVFCYFKNANFAVFYHFKNANFAVFCRFKNANFAVFWTKIIQNHYFPDNHYHHKYSKDKPRTKGKRYLIPVMPPLCDKSTIIHFYIIFFSNSYSTMY